MIPLPRYEVRRTRLRRRWYFVLIADNGEIICTSEVYNSGRACQDGIESVRDNASTTDIYTQEGQRLG